MQSTSTTSSSLLNCCNSQHPHSNLSPQNLKFKHKFPNLKIQNQNQNHSSPTKTKTPPPPSSNNCCLNQPHKSNPNPQTPHFHQITPQFDSTQSPHKYPNREIPSKDVEFVKETPLRSEAKTVFLSNMWWADLKAALGQRVNFEGIVSAISVVVKDRHLALPHVSVPDVRYIDWEELGKRGFKGVVFDKDNTITAPYSLKLWGAIGGSMDRCKSVFGQDIAVFSNSAGLSEYDHDGSKARVLEKAIDIKVIKHRVKKPAGTAEEIEKHFGCSSSQLIMVGDRPFTDIVFGNRNGFLTILTEPLTVAEEPFIVRQVRKLENAFIKYCSGIGRKATSHSLLTDASNCVIDPPPP